MIHVNITPMTESMLDEAAALEKICFSVPWSRAMLEYELTEESAKWLAAVDNEGHLAGYVGYHQVLDEGSIMNVAVHPDYRRNGIASKLLHKLFDDLTGVSMVFLEVRDSNEPAQRLYEHFGFKSCGKRRNYYENPTEDAIIMVKNM